MSALTPRSPAALLFAVGLCLGLLAGGARAQPVGVLVDGQPDATLRERAREVERALAARGLSVVGNAGLLTLLRTEGYERYRPASAGWVGELQQASEEALQDAAFGRFEGVRANADAQLARAESVLGWLGRDAEASTRLGDLCLFAVRAELRLERPDRASARAARCLRILPRLEADPDVHPESVIAVLEQARADAQAELVVVVTDTPAGCQPRLQGLELQGISRRPPGDHVLSLGCGSPSTWLRRFVLPPEGMRLTTPGALLYGLSETDGQLHVAARAGPEAVVAALAEISSVEAWVVVEANGATGPRLHYLGRQGDGFAPKATAAWAGDATATVQALWSHVQPAVPAATGSEAASAAVSAPAPKVGWTLAASAMATAGSAWGLYAGWRGRDATLQRQSPAQAGTLTPDPAYLQQLDDRDRLGAWSSALSGAAAAMALSAVPLLTRRPRARKAWPWVLGAVGVGMAGLGVWALSRGNRSETLPDGRTRTIPVVPLAPLLLSQGLSLALAPVLSESGQSGRAPRAQLGVSGYF